MTHILIDTQNLFFRARHVIRAGETDIKIGMSFHILFSSIAKAYRDFNGSHVVFCLEGKSWRKKYYSEYKKNRKVENSKKNISEIEEDEVFFEAYDELVKYLEKDTKCTVLYHPEAEADDMIARWIDNHPDTNHIIISTDSDFHQLIRDNVSQYNGVANQYITKEGIYDDKNKPVLDNKTGKHKTIGDPEWVLFEKCIRGDTSDNIFSAYPGARKKGTKNKVGMIDAFEDRNHKGFDWHNFMLQRWVDHEGSEHLVLDDYNRNKMLIDLSKQPEEIKESIDNMINENCIEKEVNQIGVRFMKFCGKYELLRMSERPNDFILFLNSPYSY